MENGTEIQSIGFRENAERFSSPIKGRTNLQALSSLRRSSLVMRNSFMKILTEEEQLLLVF